jgi:hypothetical protein
LGRKNIRHEEGSQHAYKVLHIGGEERSEDDGISYRKWKH